LPLGAGRSQDQHREGAEAGREDRSRRLRELARQVTAAGRVEIDERRVHNVAPKFEGWVERLHVNATGQPVAKGQPLFEVYSPELVSAQREYAVAARGVAALKDASAEMQSGMRQLAEASLSACATGTFPKSRSRRWPPAAKRSAR
jgi:Cu(I)/Ag(I) efflux system membrane fusion protein